MSLNAEAREKVWTPDLYWDKIVDEKPIPTDVTFQVSPDGSVWRSEHRTVRIRCALDLTNMPFDTQTCALWYALYAYTAAEVVVKWRPGRDALMGWKTSCAGVWTHPTSALCPAAGRDVG